MQWSLICDGKGNEDYRAGHSLEVIDQCYLVCGGIKKVGSLVMQMSDEERNFQKLTTYNLPYTGLREKHLSFKLPNKIVVFGGVDLKTGEIVNSLITLDLRELKWNEEKLISIEKVPCLVDFAYAKLEILPKVKTKLSKLSSKKDIEEMASNFKIKIYIFGGQCQKEMMSNKLFLIMYKNGVFSWEEVETVGETPVKRTKCSLSYHQRKNSLFLFGGESSNEPFFLNDLWEFSIQLKSWAKMELSLNVPERSNHHSTIWDDKLIIFSGLSKNMFCSNDFLIVHLEEMIFDDEIESILVEKKDTNKNVSSKKIKFEG